MKNNKFIDYKINIEISNQNKEIQNLIFKLNNFLENKKYSKIILNSLSFIGKIPVNKYNLNDEQIKKNISDLPWKKFNSKYGKSIYNFKSGFNYIKNFKEINKIQLIHLNSILTEALQENYLLSQKKLKKNGDIIFETSSGKIIDEEMKYFLDILNNGINGNFEASIIGYLFYIFVHIHPFREGNGRTMRVLVEYFLVKKLGAKIPSAFLNFYFQYTKEIHYKLLGKLNLKGKGSLEAFIYSINDGIIKGINKNLEIFKDIDKYIKEISKKLDKNGFKNNDLINDFYSNLYFENKEVYKNLELEKMLEILSEKILIESELYKGKLYYFDPKIIDILQHRY